MSLLTLFLFSVKYLFDRITAILICNIKSLYLSFIQRRQTHALAHTQTHTHTHTHTPTQTHTRTHAQTQTHTDTHAYRNTERTTEIQELLVKNGIQTRTKCSQFKHGHHLYIKAEETAGSFTEQLNVWYSCRVLHSDWNKWVHNMKTSQWHNANVRSTRETHQIPFLKYTIKEKALPTGRQICYKHKKTL